MTCRFPGCKKPAIVCDLDHTIAAPVGPTCASNLKCLCREHHLIKTFWAGACGWRDEQWPDGTVVWTDPHGHTHITKPGSYGLFPQLCRPTAPVVLTAAQRAQAVQHRPENALAMPRRRRTRALDRAARITAERRLNKTNGPPRSLPAPPFTWEHYFACWPPDLTPDDDDPPPF
jgi:hypothetical protein